MHAWRRSFATICALALTACTAKLAGIPLSDDCAITRIVDGDTVAIACDAEPVGNVRLVGFDTPESYRPSCAEEAARAEAATAYLTRVLHNAKTITPTLHGTDRYQRPLVSLDIDGTDLATLMVQSGHARPYHGERRKSWCPA